jgi:hypothetical protein
MHRWWISCILAGRVIKRLKKNVYTQSIRAAQMSAAPTKGKTEIIEASAYSWSQKWFAV